MAKIQLSVSIEEFEMKLLIKYAKKQDEQKRMSLENLSVPSKVLKIKDSLSLDLFVGANSSRH
jgi:hypothetical protein